MERGLNNPLASLEEQDEEALPDDPQAQPIPNDDETPPLLKAVDLVLADRAEIAKEAKSLHERFRERYADEKTDDEIADMTVEKIISNFSYYTAFVGGATALAGVIPGLGTVISTFGGALADTALSMKFQIEMTMAIAVVYGHDIKVEEKKRLCFIIAGLGTIHHAAREGGKTIGTKTFSNMVLQYLRGSSLVAVKQIFRNIGITFTRKALEKTIPFGVGVIIGVGVGKALTWYVGQKAKDFFKIH